MAEPQFKPSKVFISYSHDTPEHADRVLALADRLREDGIDCNIDQYDQWPSEGWPRWTMKQLEWADFVLVVCTETYHARFLGKEPPGKGQGAKWEGAIITQELYDAESNNSKFVPVVFTVGDTAYIPIMLRGVARFDLSTESGYELLYRRLTNQPNVKKPALGKFKPLAARERKETFWPLDAQQADSEVVKSRRIDDNEMNEIDASQGGIEKEDKLHPSRVDYIGNSLAETERRKRGVISKSVVGVVLGVVAISVFVILWLRPLAPNPSDYKPIEVYKLRLLVFDLQGKPLDDVEIKSSPGGNKKEVSPGWEIEIPASTLSQDKKVTVYAENPKASLRGQGEIMLGEDPSPLLKINMEKYEEPPDTQENSNKHTTPPRNTAIDIYRMRVTVLDPQGSPVDDADVVSSVGGEPKKVRGGWQLDIPSASLPANRQLTVYAEKRNAFLKGREQVRLGSDANPSITIRLVRDTSAQVRGRVVDDRTLRPIAGAEVSVVGQEDKVITGTNGEFKLAAHAAEGQTVRLRATKDGYQAKEQYDQAGNDSVTIRLQPRRRIQ